MGDLEETYSAFASASGMALRPQADLGPLTPLLEESGGGAMSPVCIGRLGEGIDGAVGHISYHRNTTFRFNAAVTEIAESAAFSPRLFCIRNGRVTRDDEFYGFGVRNTKVWTESVALSERYTVTTSPYQDPNWMRQLLSPVVIDWLVSVPPEDFSFELAYGVLLGSVESDDPGPDGLKALVAAVAHLGKRVRAECGEG